MLVGVVIFVLALTILGLSLFSLSSYEATFLGREIHRADAFHSALGGIDRAKFVLAARDSLGAIKLLEGSDHIVYARARYADAPDDTVGGPMDWSGTRDLEVRVLAEVRGQRRMVEARFQPRRSGSIYENLITSYGGVTIVDSSDVPEPLHPRYTQTFLNGRVQQNSADTTWRNLAQTTSGIPIRIGGVPMPSAADYIAAWHGSAVAPGYVAEARYELISTLDYTHFIGGPPGPKNGYGLDNRLNDHEIRVSGTAVWLLPDGAYFDQQVTVTGMTGGANDRLIIVATKSSHTMHTPSPGLNFRGGLHAPQVPVILISDGTVAIDQYNDYPNGNAFAYLSIFAANVYLKGPWDGAPPVVAAYNHVSGSPYTDASVLDDLIAWGILPDVMGTSTAAFPLVAGTWREVNETDPD
jgi:hypothetical protein